MIHQVQLESISKNSELKIFNLPGGLEYIVHLDKIIIERNTKSNELEWGEGKSHIIKNENGEKIYCKFEQSDASEIICCAQCRGVLITIVDNSNQPVLIKVKPRIY